MCVLPMSRIFEDLDHLETNKISRNPGNPQGVSIPDVCGRVPPCRSITNNLARATRRRKIYCFNLVVCWKPSFASASCCAQLRQTTRPRSSDVHIASFKESLNSLLQVEHARQGRCHLLSSNLKHSSSIVLRHLAQRSECESAKFSDNPAVDSSDCFISLVASRFDSSSRNWSSASALLCSRSWIPV